MEKELVRVNEVNAYYIYQADIWCQSCGLEICNRLRKHGEAPENTDDQTTYDSNEYPKECCDSGESDSPQHCAAGPDCLEYDEPEFGWKVGKFLENDLTQDGYDYVKEYLKTDPNSAVVRLWANYYSITVDDDEEEDDED